MRMLVVIAAAVMTAACFTGPAARNHPMVVSAHGARVHLTLRRSQVAGELLEASDSAVIVRTKAAIELIPRAAIRTLIVANVHQRHLKGPIEPARLRSIARFSRYPGGMPQAVRTRLLANARQESLRVRAQ